VRGHEGWRLSVPLPLFPTRERAPHPHLNPEAGWGQPTEAPFFFPLEKETKRKKHRCGGDPAVRVAQAVSGRCGAGRPPWRLGRSCSGASLLGPARL